MDNISPYVPDLLRLVKRTYPDWNSFDDPDFVEDEMAYKREASQLAKELLGKEALQSLLATGDYDEFISRLRKVAAKTNLLFLGVPQKGDLALIRQPDADPGPICHAVYDLLHGDGPSEKRLEAFFDFVTNNDLPQKWTFPTYYLFLLYPQSEIFVKPRVMNWFSKELDGLVPYSSQPDAATYEEMRSAFHALRDELGDYDVSDMIDIQSFVWVARNAAQKSAAFDKVIERLRIGLGEIENFEDMVEIEEHKDEVIGRYGTMFSVDHLPQLTAEEFTSFLRYENNHHWSGINRYGSRIAQDMPKLREALTALQDESRPIAERFDEVRESVKGLGKAVLTPILLVTNPDRYGVWNGKQITAFQQLKIYPEVSNRDSEGAQYAEINALLNELADELGVDLWTLDILWAWVTRQSKLAEPFATIFEDRDQSEWAFDFFAETVDRLGGDEADKRFAMTIRHGDSMQRLNFGNWMLLDISQSRDFVDLALLIEPMESHFSFDHWGPFANDDAVAVFEIPIETAQEWPPELQSIYEASMDHIGEHFRNWKRSPYLYAHRDDIFQALFDEGKRENLLSKGLKWSDQEKRFWRITLPTDVRREMEEGRRTYDLWQDCLRHGMAAIGFDDDPESPQIARFAQIEQGDKVVAFLRNKTIGGIGEVIAPLDERVAQERPADQDYFDGNFWLRIGVDWQPEMLSVDALPTNVRNKFGQGTVLELSESEFETVEKAMVGDLIISGAGAVVANEFGGFTADAFTFMEELGANNNKEWMKENQDRWRDSVREPMRALFTDLGPLLKPKFDPYLVPDALEIRPTAHQVLARINKNWAAKPGSLYYEWYWGAFYRESLTRQTDAQLFVSLDADVVRFGFFTGQSAKSVCDQFRQRVLDDLEGFYRLIDDLQLAEDFEFVRTHEEEKREIIDIDSAGDLREWVESGDYDLLQPLTPEEVVGLGPALADRIYDALRRVFPVYLWAVADDSEPTVERYLAAEFPVADIDLDEEIESEPDPYTEDDFLDATYLTDEMARELQEMLEDRRQAVFFGPPGTGKTYVARHLGKLVTGLAEPPAERLEIIQFHPAYSYEDFIEGIRPQSKQSDGRTIIDYPSLPGVFVKFCRRAESIDGPCVFIIDEINRGNIARIFGELMLLLEYRNLDVPLPYSGDRFRIPENVYIIGTMNTADRSIALVDFALRRRFHFFHFAADPDLFDRWLDANPSTIPYLGELYRRLSQEAVDDPHFAVGPSYFMRDDLTERKLERIWRRSILPYLQEYYFDQEAKAQRWAWDSEFMRGIRGNLYGD